MSLKQEIETWVAALAYYDNNQFSEAITCFEQIADTSKILFNCGVIHATLGEHAKAVACYRRATELDNYLAIAYFQSGVSNFLMGDFEEALVNFNDALGYLRGNKYIDYEQLGLKFKLYSCEVLFNRGLCYVYLQQTEHGMNDLEYARREKMVPDHDVIDEAIQQGADTYTVFSIGVGVVYRPNEAKVKNLKQKDYLGRARLIAQQDQQFGDSRKRAAMAAMAVDDRQPEKLSYAALNLVRPDLRNRQQSEPPLRRNIFPPTPPPELEKAEFSHSRRKSIESMNSEGSALQQARPGAKALRLELGAAAFDQKSASKPRLGTKRSESERPALRREHSGASTRSTDARRQEQRSSYRGAPEVRIVADPIEAYSEQATAQVQQMSHHQRSRSSAPRVQPIAIEEEAEEGDYSPSVTDSPLAYEISPPKQSSSGAYSRHRSQSRRAPELRKIRIKVHAEDMRYVMTTPSVTFEELSAQIRTKFGVTGGLKLKIKDEEGDMVTIGDADDLDMAMGICRAAAAREKMEMGKMEMWLQEV